jgi:hypothetical protein
LVSHLNAAADLVEETAGITRDLMEGLRSTVLEHYGLMGGVRYLRGQFIKKTGIDLEIPGEEADPRLNPNIELAPCSHCPGGVE